MNLQIFAATLLLALPVASAQTPLPQLRIEPTTGGSIFFVKNVSTQPLTGYLIELVDYPGSSFTFWQDLPSAEPVAPGQEKRMQVANMTVGAVPDYVKLQAAVYADGTIAGQPGKVTQLLDHRRTTLQTLRDVIQRLNAAKREKTPKEILIAMLKEKADTMHPKKATQSQIAAGKIYSDTAAQLGNQSLEETLAALQKSENILAASKPAL